MFSPPARKNINSWPHGEKAFSRANKKKLANKVSHPKKATTGKRAFTTVHPEKEFAVVDSTLERNVGSSFAVRHGKRWARKLTKRGGGGLWSPRNNSRMLFRGDGEIKWNEFISPRVRRRSSLRGSPPACKPPEFGGVAAYKTLCSDFGRKFSFDGTEYLTGALKLNYFEVMLRKMKRSIWLKNSNFWWTLPTASQHAH